jgi:hypothetical protein
MDDGCIGFVLLDQDAVKSQVPRSLSGTSDPGEWIEHSAAGRGD